MQSKNISFKKDFMEEINDKTLVEKHQHFLAVALSNDSYEDGYGGRGRCIKTTVFTFVSLQELESFLLENKFNNKYIKILAYKAFGLNYSTSIKIEL